MRGCEEKPTLLNDVIDDPTFKTFYRSCSADLCNDGDGTRSTSQQNISPDGYNGENLLVPGLPFNRAPLIIKSSFNFLCALAAIVIFVVQ